MKRPLPSLPEHRRHRTLQACLLTAGLLVGFDASTAGQDDTAGDEAAAVADAHDWFDLRRQAAPPGNVEAGRTKALLCATCHGSTGAASVAPMIPNVAGQSADYLYWELLEYKRGTLVESPMTVLTADISEEDIRDLASFYAVQTPGAHTVEADAAAPDPELLTRGEHLYRNGDPARGIPACQGCHGADARRPAFAGRTDSRGHAPYAAYPALRSQRDVYLQARLAAFRDGKMRYSTTDFVMTGIGRQLDDDSILALSTWLSSLEP